MQRLLTLAAVLCRLSAVVLVDGATANMELEEVIPYSERVFVTRQLRALRLCARENVDFYYYANETGYCDLDFDGWGCWPQTPAGETAFIPCPTLLLGANSSALATRFCEANGEWSKESETEEFLIDYGNCNANLSQKPNTYLLERVIKDLRRARLNPYEEPENEESLEKCIVDVLLSPEKKEGLYCRRIYDGWGCWNDTKAGEIAYTPCPTFKFFAPPGSSAFKICNEDGTWWRRPDNNMTWSNYTNCVDLKDLEFRNIVDYLYVGGYSISVVALSISLLIYLYFKSLKCTRITIHKNLFVAFILSSLLWMVWHLGIPKISYIENGVGCQALHVLVHYFMVASYFWMFCEGFYLHTLLVVTFLSETRVMYWLYAIGWGFPAVIILVYSLARGTDTDHSNMCWTNDSSYRWIFEAPVCLSLLLNLAFLINIIRVLIVKLRALNTPEAQQTKKAVRATIILVPLLGLHYLLLPLRPKPRTTGEYIFEITSVLVNSLQGFCIALLFCLFNSEVISLLKKTWQQMRLMRGRTKSYSSANTSYSTVTKTTHESPPIDAKKQNVQKDRLLFPEDHHGYEVTSV